MARLIESPTRVPVPGGKVIDEYLGRVNTGQDEVSAGERVRYSTGEAETEYVAICLPAFSPEAAHRDPDEDTDD